MDVDQLGPHQVVALGLLALLPVAWYALTLSGTAGVFAAINVVIVFVALYVAMQPIDDHGHDGTSA